MDTTSPQWRYLARKPRSNYEHLYIKDRWISARTIYGRHVSEEEPMTVEEIAEDYSLPVEAVREAISYCESKPPEIARDFAREEARVRATQSQLPPEPHQQGIQGTQQVA